MPEPSNSPATRADLHDLEIALVDRMQRPKRQQLSLAESVAALRETVAKLHNSVWLQIVVPTITLIVSLVIHYLLRHS
jgi:hypothetical protein